METATAWAVTSIDPEPRMSHNVNQEFTLTLAPGGIVSGVVSERPAFAKVRHFQVTVSQPDKIVMTVDVHGMNAGTLDVPFTIRLRGGEASFVIRTIG